MDTDDTTQPPTATPAPTLHALQAPQYSDARPAEQTPSAPTGERVLDLVALLLLIALAATVFVLAGPGAFTAVTSAGMGLFATWRSRR
ncbi:hypothetical protein ACGFX4_09070 [Kitasatospora sp. NPDC048365]|uniref:hypothetical protein n=1 Tax=Kitasatospora sp. NPDC048365 TaxID=3364050 RepID=UPI003717C569